MENVFIPGGYHNNSI